MLILPTGYGPRSLGLTSELSRSSEYSRAKVDLYYNTKHSRKRMATGADEKWVIDTLDGPNWTTWKFQIKHLLLAKGLWGVVDGTEVLADDAAEGVCTEFQKKSQKAFSTLVLAITASQLYLVTSCEQARDAWVALRNHFERDTLANKLFLKKQYFRTEMKEGTSAEKHLTYMKELTDRLAAIGAPIDEEDQVVTLLGACPRVIPH